MHIKKAILAAVVMSATGLLAYNDDYITSSDDSVVKKTVGDRVVYVFTDAAAPATVTFKQTMTLEECLVVGGGGAGGGAKGGGGGGGGVISDQPGNVLFAGGQLTVTVGAGGIGSNLMTAAAPQGRGSTYGLPSSLVGSGVNIVAFGGGAGGSDGWAPSMMTADIHFGCGGGAGAKNTTILDSESYYTAGQGSYGGRSLVNVGPIGSGGGGGASEPGEDCVRWQIKVGEEFWGKSGNGGEGVTSQITGEAEVYGSGGGGGGGHGISSGNAPAGKGGTHAGDGGDADETSATAGGAGDNGFGGGGGGGAYSEGAGALSTKGGDGGSGTVILALTVGGSASKPEFDEGDVTVTYSDGETQPRVQVACGGPAGYVAEVTILCGTGPAAQAGEAYASTNVIGGVRTGDTPAAYAYVYPNPGEDFFVKVIARCEGVEDTVVTTSFTVPTDQGLHVPTHVGRGGGPGVIHVRPGAHGRNDGSCWSDAYVDFREAITKLSSDRAELWLSGDESYSIRIEEPVNPPAGVTIRGGFSGTEDAAGERLSGRKSLIDGGKLGNCMILANEQSVTIEGFAFVHGRNHGVDKSGAGDIVLSNCCFEANGEGTGSNNGRDFDPGRAIRLQGKARATIANCRIASHYESDFSYGSAGAVYVNGLASAHLSDCLFVSNGLQFASIVTPFERLSGRVGTWGVALAVNATTTTVERCRFSGNAVPSSDFDATDFTGGIVAFRGASGGSVLRNCAFVGNECLFGFPYPDTPTDLVGGILTVALSQSDDAVLVENCTFAHNLYEGVSGSAGVNVRSGCANVRNSIFHDNRTGSYAGTPPTDIRVQDGASADVAYSIFDVGEGEASASRRADEGGTLVERNCIVGNPLFVTADESMDGLIATDGLLRSKFTAAAQAELIGFDVHVRKRSPAIDTGDPQSPYANEPSPNGRRVNLGRYGNTPEAALSKFGLAVLIY